MVRIAPNEVSFASPNAAKDILAVGKGFNKTDFYKVFPPPENPDIFTEIREWKHAQMKRFAVTPYSMASIQKLVPCIEDVERQLMKKLDGFAGDSRQVCDLGDWLHYFAFDVCLYERSAAHWSLTLTRVRFSEKSHSRNTMASSLKGPTSTESLNSLTTCSSTTA